MSKFKPEFAAHPDAKELYVVNGMPFLEKGSAENFQRGTDHKLEVVERETEATEGPSTSFAKLTKDQIIEELTTRKVEFDAKAKKADLIALLEAYEAKSEEE